MFFMVSWYLGCWILRGSAFQFPEGNLVSEYGIYSKSQNARNNNFHNYHIFLTATFRCEDLVRLKTDHGEVYNDYKKGWATHVVAVFVRAWRCVLADPVRGPL